MVTDDPRDVPHCISGRNQVPEPVVLKADRHSGRVHYLGQLPVPPLKLGAPAQRVHDHRGVPRNLIGILIRDDRPGLRHQRGDAVLLIPAVGEVRAFRGHGPDFPAPPVVGVHRDGSVALRERHQVSVAVVGHGLPLVMGIEHADQAALRVGDPRVGPGAVLIRNDRDPAGQIREPGPAPMLGGLQDNPAVFVVGVLCLENARSRDHSFDQALLIPPVGARPQFGCHARQPATGVVLVLHPAPVRGPHHGNKPVHVVDVEETAPHMRQPGHQSANTAVGWPFPKNGHRPARP